MGRREREGPVSAVSPGATSGPASSPERPRRSALLQARSRSTRRQLVVSALALWGARGFERGVEETARAAGVTKGTFYFHFAHKEDILLELGWVAAAAMFDEAEAGISEGVPSDRIIDDLVRSLARRVERVPRAAVIRSAAEFHRRAHDASVRPAGARGFADAFCAVARYAIARGELPRGSDPVELANVLEAAVMDTLLRWAANEPMEDRRPLAVRLWVAARLVLAGARVVYADCPAGAFGQYRSRSARL